MAVYSPLKSSRIMCSKRITIVLGLVLVAAIAVVGYQDAVRTWQNLQKQQNHIEALGQQTKTLDKELDSVKELKTKSQAEVRKLESEKNNLEKERQRLEKELQAKAEKKEAEAKLAAASRAKKTVAPKTVTAAVQKTETPKDDPFKPAPVVGDKWTWLAQSIIPKSSWEYVDYIVTRESGWNPNAVNRQTGACGLAQQMPCGKWPGAWNDPVNTLNNMQIYINRRYGSSWAVAVQHVGAMGHY